MRDDPFAELGLPALSELTDDDVRAAWRRIAAATHPDREDGGDPARFGAAAAAYALLRTSFGRGEALADLAGAPRRRSRRAPRARRARRSRPPWRSWRLARPWSPWQPQRPGSHRQRGTASPARFRHAADGGFKKAGHASFRSAVSARFRQAVPARFRPAVARFRSVVFPGFGPAVRARYRRTGYAGVDRGLALPAGGAARGAAAAIAAVGWTPATIGLGAGALPVTGWGLWRRAWRDR